MVQRIRDRLTYSNVVATLALFIALGGVSYAAVELPRNSVGSTQIRKNAVTGSKVKDGSLTGADVTDASLTGADVTDASLTAADLKGTFQGPKGDRGVKGDKGLQGDVGPKGDTGPKGDPGELLEVAPTGSTMRGIYDVFLTATAADQFASDSVSYPVPLASEPDVHFVPAESTPPGECTTGTNGDPLPGNLCVYGETPPVLATFYGILDPTTSTSPASAPTGFSIMFQSSGAGPLTSRGSWVVTAP